MDVGLQRDREQRVDHEQREREADLHAADRLFLFGLHALESVEHTRVARQHVRQDGSLQLGDDRSA